MFDFNFGIDFSEYTDYVYVLGLCVGVVIIIYMIMYIKEWYLSLIPLILLIFYGYYFKRIFDLPYFYEVLILSVISITLLLFSGNNNKKKGQIIKEESLKDIKLETTTGDVFLKNIFSGLLVYGASGSGKTESILYQVLKHFGKYKYSGIVYDYKDGELTEILYPLFSKVDVIALHNPNISVQINPVHPDYIQDETDASDIAKVLVLNLANSKDEGGDKFFIETSEALITAVVLKLAFDHPQYCTLPHIISLILAVDFSIEKEKENKGNYLGSEGLETFAKLKNFLLSNTRVQIQASSFVLGLASEKQTASVISTLANLLRKISSPNLFYVLSKNQIDLDLNTSKGQIISILNKPSKDNYLSPVLALIVQTITKRMMERDRESSFVLLDEAPTIKLANMKRIPATMRSFGISTVYCAQDVVQGYNQYGKDGFKEITANLSNIVLGKANNADTGKEYESLFEKIKEKQKSTNRSTNKSGASKGYTISEREVAKMRAFDFTMFDTGDFAILANGIQEKVKIKKQDIERTSINQINEISKEDLNKNFEKIIKEINALISINYS